MPNEEITVTSNAWLVAKLAFAALAISVLLNIGGALVLGFWLAETHAQGDQTSALARQTAIVANRTADLAKQAVVVKEAACSYRAYLADGAKRSQQYLDKHPDGAPALGITAAQVEQQIKRQKGAVNALSDLHCS